VEPDWDTSRMWNLPFCDRKKVEGMRLLISENNSEVFEKMEACWDMMVATTSIDSQTQKRFTNS
jgi:hypothetical protein